MGNPVQRPCGWCSGSGEVLTGPASAVKEKCGVCSGQGHLMMDSKTTACPDCSGTGEVTESEGLLDVILGSERRCPRCKGTGWAKPV